MATILYRSILCILFFTLYISTSIFSQISPPGLGKTKAASWLALGLRQVIDSSKRIQSVSYLGIGRKSGHYDYNLYLKPAIFVINQEFYHQFHPHWQYSLALSYRRQNEYQDIAPYGLDSPPIKQEFRVYGRYSHILKIKCSKIVTTFRQEFRKFYTLDFKNSDDIFQLRSRIRIHVGLDLDKTKMHKLTGSYEALFSSSRENVKQKLSPWAYKESRFCFYYSFSPHKIPVIFNIGYMNNLLGTTVVSDVHYVAFDIILKNPFVRRKFIKKRTKIIAK